MWGDSLGLLDKIFGKYKDNGKNSDGNSPQVLTDYKFINLGDATNTSFMGSEWDISTVRAAVTAFAKHAAKITPRHIRRTEGAYVFVDDEFDRILQYAPNPYMNSYNFYYKIAVAYKLDNNAFIYPVWDEGRLTALYPVMTRQVKIKEIKGVTYCVFQFQTGNIYYIPYDEIIHIKNHYYENEIFGSNNKALSTVLKTARTLNQSISKFAELISVIRGILKTTVTSKDEDLNKKRDEFVRDNLRMDNNGSGIIVTDNKYDYTPIQDKTTPVPASQLTYIQNEIYDYFGINSHIIQNKFTEWEWNAFYEGEIEPFCIQLSQAMTNCFFTDRERGFGNEIFAEANRLQYASMSSKISAATFLANLGAVSVDQILEIFNMAPIGGEEGKRRVQNLNFINSKLADQYQSNKTNESNEEENQNDNQEG